MEHLEVARPAGAVYQTRSNLNFVMPVGSVGRPVTSRPATPVSGKVTRMRCRSAVKVVYVPEPAKWIGHDESSRLESFRQQQPEGRGVGIGVDGVRRFYALAPVGSWGLTVVAGVRLAAKPPTKSAKGSPVNAPKSPKK